MVEFYHILNSDTIRNYPERDKQCENGADLKLVFPNGEETVLPPQQNEARLRIGFNGSATADKPLIATMAAEHGILANILGASTRAFHEQAFVRAAGRS